MSKIARIAARLRLIGPRPALLARYVAYELDRKLRRRQLRRTYATRIAAGRERGRLVLPSIDLPPAEELPAALAPGAARIRAEAEQIMEHRVDFLGSGLVDLGPEIDWHRDFKSGYRWPSAFYLDVQVTRLDDDSDAKVPWELSRGHQLLTLARAAVLFDDERYAAELERQLDSWLEANPPGHGINWVNAMEVALRAVNWVWAAGTLESKRPLDGELRARLATSLRVHARHVAANLEGTPFLRSNHFLADVLGLAVVGASFEDEPAARRWLRLGQRSLEREILKQVHDDGLAFEASLAYHGLVLEMFLIAREAAARVGSPFSPAFDERLRRMLVASRAVRHPDGRVPQLGDSDSGRVLPAGFDRPATIDHLLWLGAAVVGGERPLDGDPHEEVAWTLGIDAWRRAAELPRAAADTPTAFPRGGLYVLRSSDAHAVLRCGDVGQNGNGGHAHNDALSFELSFGTPLVVDSGTYVYTADPAARNAFRGTAAHNTVVVADEEINPFEPGRLFELHQAGTPRVESWEDAPDEVRVVATHDGYRRLTPPVVHRRTLTLSRRRPRLEVRDELLGQGEQHATGFLHLAPGTTVERTADGAFALRRGEARARLAFDGAVVEVRDGWCSETYGVRVHAPVLAASVAGELPLAFGYVIEAVDV